MGLFSAVLAGLLLVLTPRAEAQTANNIEQNFATAYIDDLAIVSAARNISLTTHGESTMATVAAAGDYSKGLGVDGAFIYDRIKNGCIQVTKDPATGLYLFPDTAATLEACIDLQQGKRIEVEALQGTVVRRGAARGVPTPIISTLYSVLKLHAAGQSR